MRARALVFLALLALPACRAGSAVGTYREAPVVLISIDTLRADHLPLYGYQAGATPSLDALGRESLVFEDAYSHCPTTLPAHASLLTGLLPPRHGVRDNIGFTLAADHATLATRLEAAGWRTGGAVSAYVLRSQTGIAQGFDFFDDALQIEAVSESLGTIQRDGALAVDALSRWIEGQGDAPVFAFLHLYEPHSPYAPPAAHRRLATPYDGEIAYADELVGRFLSVLKARGIYDRAVLVVTSDHGEGLRDHGEEEHGIFLYREAVHVPLLVRLPGGTGGGRRIPGSVAHVDVAATILDLVGQAPGGLDGRSLRAALVSGRADERPVYSETLYPRYHFGWSDLYAVTEGRFRYVRAPRPELFDLGLDPGETRNIVDSRGSAAAAMTAWLERQVAAASVAAPEEVSPEVREKLQALGYIGAGSARVAEGELPDPKDKIGSYEELKRALRLRQDKNDAEAVEVFRKVLADNPRMVDAWEMLGTTLVRSGRAKEGLEALAKVLEIDPVRHTTHIALAKYWALQGKQDLVRKHAEIAAERNPGQGYELLAQLMMDQRRPDLAGEFARRSVAADDQRTMSHFVLGALAQKAGRYEEALASFLRAEESRKRRKQAMVRNLHANMADCLARLGREAEAEREFLAEIQAIPASREGRVGLAMLYRSQRRDAEARQVLSTLVTADPEAGPEAYWTVVRTFAVLGDVEAAREWSGRARSRFPEDPRFRSAPR